DQQGAMPSVAVAPTELKTLRDFRDTWIRLSVERQLSRSQQKVPANPGPLNSHLLVLRALRRMQEISPAYLERYMAHVEILLWLEQARIDTTASPPGLTARPDAGRKRKPAAAAKVDAGLRRTQARRDR
ncbi:MAG: DUF2894 domain-containing protein, partial [Betaproteobacteria bacterium]